ncbi:MAG: glycosyltransferase family 2 protein [Armatimonadetes bacterium]|nr:glycosyltransferase family 2 protein [Armatimonadota bacterium]
MKVCVLMPVYNEERTLETIVERVLAAPIEEICIVMVDDGSTDGTRQVMEKLASRDNRIRILRHPANRGKGAALRTALQHAEGEIVIFQDADLEYDPADYPALIEPIREGRADAVFGSRFMRGGLRLPWPQRMANRMVTGAFNLLFGTRLTDLETGSKAFRTGIFDPSALQASRFDIEIEIAARLLAGGARIVEVPVRYQRRSYAEGKKIRWHDLLHALWAVIKWRLTRLGKGTRTDASRECGH